MKLHIRAESKNHNGASITYTWRNVDAQNEREAFRLGMDWTLASDYKFGKIASSVKVWFVTNNELEIETRQYAKEKAEFELFCGGYHDSL